jgi:hypothetical protein
MSTMDYKEEAKIWMKGSKLDENIIKIGVRFNFTSIKWANVKIICFTVIFHVASLDSQQI